MPLFLWFDHFLYIFWAEILTIFSLQFWKILEIKISFRAQSNFFQDAFRENLSYIKWMSPASAVAAKAKLEHMADLIGFPNFVLNSTWLDQGMYLYV